MTTCQEFLFSKCVCKCFRKIATRLSLTSNKLTVLHIINAIIRRINTHFRTLELATQITRLVRNSYFPLKNFAQLSSDVKQEFQF